MQEKIFEILKSIRSDIDFRSETALVDNGLLDSFDLVSIVSDLNDEFDVRIRVEDLQPENFNSLDSIGALIAHLQDED